MKTKKSKTFNPLELTAFQTGFLGGSWWELEYNSGYYRFCAEDILLYDKTAAGLAKKIHDEIDKYALKKNPKKKSKYIGKKASEISW